MPLDNNFDKDLELALRRERPPAGFAARVMQRVGEEERSMQRDASRGHASWWGAVAATLLLTITGGGWLAQHEIERQQIERQQGERAKAQVLLALRITGAKMHAAREQVRELESRSGEAPENVNEEKH